MTNGSSWWSFAALEALDGHNLPGGFFAHTSGRVSFHMTRYAGTVRTARGPGSRLIPAGLRMSNVGPWFSTPGSFLHGWDSWPRYGFGPYCPRPKAPTEHGEQLQHTLHTLLYVARAPTPPGQPLRTAWVTWAMSFDDAARSNKAALAYSVCA